MTRIVSLRIIARSYVAWVRNAGEHEGPPEQGAQGASICLPVYTLRYKAPE